jgi:hypothetical protein
MVPTALVLATPLYLALQGELFQAVVVAIPAFIVTIICWWLLLGLVETK